MRHPGRNAADSLEGEGASGVRALASFYVAGGTRPERFEYNYYGGA